MLRSFKHLLIINTLLLFVMVKCSFNSDINSSISPGSANFTAVRPANNSIDQSIIQTFNWTADNAVSYDVYLDNVNPPVKIIASKTNKLSYNYPTPLQYSTTYYWKVAANFPDGSQKISPVWKFTTSADTTSGLTGYAFGLKSQSTSLPNFVNYLFQVVDLNNIGITTLQRSDFEVLEDGLPIQSESLIDIKKQNQIPYKLRTVIMVDNSTSLSTAAIDSIRNAVYSFISKMKPNQEIAIYQFSENVEMLAYFTNRQDSLNRAASRYNRGKSTTGLYSAVAAGAALWQDDFTINNVLQGAMIVFTDGNETSRPNAQAYAEAFNSVKDKLVFTIGLRGNDQLDEETLKNLGPAGYYGIDDVSQLDNSFTLIQNRIIAYANSFYQLTYKSPRRGTGEYNLKIGIKGNPYTGYSSYILGKYNSAGFYSN